jgi:hypothetical protein
MGGGSEDERYIELSNIMHTAKNSKTDVLASVLRGIMIDLGINDTQYMIMAGYCLRDVREVGDLDVIVSESAFDKLRDKIGELKIAKISGDARIALQFKDIDENAEIEFFPKKRQVGFPTDYFSMGNLQDKDLLIKDKFGNPYYNIETCVGQYSAPVVTKEGNKYFMGKYEIDRARIEKNISHLDTLKTYFNNHRPELVETIHMIDGKIKELKDMI